MIGYLLCHWKIIPVAITLWIAAALFAIQGDASPWIFGALVPIGLFILGVLIALLKAAWGIQSRMSIVETQVSPLWASFQQQVAKTLHNPELRDKEADGLINELEAQGANLAPEKVERLRVLMVARSNDKSRPEQERKRAVLLLFIMSMVENEKLNYE